MNPFFFHLQSMVACACLFALTACDAGPRGGTDIGNALSAIEMAARSSDDPGAEDPAGDDAQGTALTVQAARAYLRHIQLDLPTGTPCDSLGDSDDGLVAPLSCEADKLTIEGPFVIDLLERTSDPSLQDLRLPELTYTRVDVRFDDADPEDGLVDEADPLAESTLLVQGEFEYQAATTTYTVLLDFNEDARFESPEGIRVTDEEVSTLLLSLDVARWFSALPITQCLDAGDLVVDGGHVDLNDDQGGACGALENELKDAIKESGRLERGED
jgi:hypothetical protein